MRNVQSCNVQVSSMCGACSSHRPPPMVQALVAKCISQTEKLTALLHSSALRELEVLMTQMAPSSYRLKQEPKTMRALAQALDTHKARGGAAALEERFQPLYDVYDLLERREVGCSSTDEGERQCMVVHSASCCACYGASSCC